MNPYRKSTSIAGGLFIVGIIAGLLSIAPSIGSPDYLVKASENSNQIFVAAFFQFIMTVTYVGIAIALYPILRNFNQSLALGFVGFRIIASVFIIAGVLSLLLLLALSQEYVQAGVPDSSYYKTLGGLLRTIRDLINHVGMILSLCISELLFNYLLYQTKLIPRWLSVWGLIGVLFTVVASFLVMFRRIEIISIIYVSLNFPLALQEMVLAIWLIIKGFDKLVMAVNR